MRKFALAFVILALSACSLSSPVGTITLGPNGLSAVPASGGTSAPPPVVVTPPGTTTPPPVVVVADANSYPLALSAPDATNTQTAGSGPDQLDIYLSSNPGGAPATNDVVITATNGAWAKVLVAPRYNVSALVGMTKAGANHLVLKGVFDCSKIRLDIKGVGPGGINGLWVMGATCNYADLVANGLYDSRGGISVNAVATFISNGADISLTPPLANAGGTVGGGSGGSVPVAATTIAAATVNGAAVPDNTLDKLCAALPPSSTLRLPAGQIFGSCFLPGGASLEGAGIGKTIIDGKGIRPFQDKALIVVGAPGSTIRGVTIQNAAISESLGGNAAGVRDNGPGIGYNLANVELANNQNGALTFASNFNLEGVNAHDNGTGSGYTHDLYFGGSPSTVVNFSNGSVSKSNGGHALKSRAGTTKVSGSTLTAGGNGAALDVPDGGLALVENTRLVMPLGLGPTLNMVTFALESASNAATGLTLTLNNVVWDSVGQAILQGGNGAKIACNDNNTYTGTPPDIRGFAGVCNFKKAN